MADHITDPPAFAPRRNVQLVAFERLDAVGQLKAIAAYPSPNVHHSEDATAFGKNTTSPIGSCLIHDRGGR